MRAWSSSTPARSAPSAAAFTLTAGEFYSGHRQQFEYNGRVKVSSQLAFEPRILASHISLVEGTFTTKLLGARTTYTVTPRMFISGLVQYNSSPQHVGVEHSLAVGVSAGQRSLHRLYGRPRHIWRTDGRADEPGRRNQGNTAASLLTDTLPDCRAAAKLPAKVTTPQTSTTRAGATGD